jgi:hypothetical protein
MVTPIPGLEALEGLSDAAKVNRIMRETGVPRSIAKAILKQDVSAMTKYGGERAPPHLTPRLKAAGELEAKGHKVLGQLPEVAHDNWIRWVYNQALAPIGKSIGHKEAVGTVGAAKIRRLVMEAYDRANARARGIYDVNLRRSMDLLIPSFAKRRGVDLEPQYRSVYDRWVKKVKSRFDASGNASGQTIGTTISELRAEAAKQRRLAAKGGKDAAQHEMLADMLASNNEDAGSYSIVRALRENMDRSSSPDVVAALKKADQAYSRVMRVRDATRAARNQGGHFTPTHLMSAVDKGATRAGAANAVAEGRAVMQREAQVGLDALKPLERSDALKMLQRSPTWILGGLPGALLGHQFAPGFFGEALGLAGGAAISDFLGRLIPQEAKPRPGLVTGPLERRKLAKVATSQMGGHKRVAPRGTGAALTAAGVEREEEQ